VVMWEVLISMTSSPQTHETWPAFLTPVKNEIDKNNHNFITKLGGNN